MTLDVISVISILSVWHTNKLL